MQSMPPADERESAYELFQRGSRMLADRHSGAAAVLLERALALEPGKASILEALGQAYFNQGRPPARGGALRGHRRGRSAGALRALRARPVARAAGGRARRAAPPAHGGLPEARQRVLPARPGATRRRGLGLVSGGRTPPSALLARQPRLEQAEHGRLLRPKRVRPAAHASRALRESASTIVPSR